jgi:hypothetical protein
MARIDPKSVWAGRSEKLHSGNDIGPQNYLADRKAVA